MDGVDWSKRLGNCCDHTVNTSTVWIQIGENENVSYSDLLFGNFHVIDVAKGLGRMFYVVSRTDTTFENHQEVPSFFINVSTYNSRNIMPRYIKSH